MLAVAVAVGPHFEIKFANTSACFMPWPRVFSFCHQICRVGYKSGVHQCAGEFGKKRLNRSTKLSLPSYRISLAACLSHAALIDTLSISYVFAGKAALLLILINIMLKNVEKLKKCSK